MNRRITLDLNALNVESLEMPAAATGRAVTTSQTCPTRCDTEFDCSYDYCTNVC